MRDINNSRTGSTLSQAWKTEEVMAAKAEAAGRKANFAIKDKEERTAAVDEELTTTEKEELEAGANLTEHTTDRMCDIWSGGILTSIRQGRLLLRVATHMEQLRSAQEASIIRDGGLRRQDAEREALEQMLKVRADTQDVSVMEGFQNNLEGLFDSSASGADWVPRGLSFGDVRFHLR